MANVAHSTLTGANLHEPKAIAAASAATAYIANGSGSGTWQKIGATEINTSSIKNLNQIVLTLSFDYLATAHSHFIVCPLAGTISKIYSVIDKAVATTDTILTAKIAGTNVTNGAITIAHSGSAAGTVDVATPSGAKTVTAGQAIEISGNGGTNTSDAHAHITLLMDVS